jgi:hypothetical protein
MPDIGFFILSILCMQIGLKGESMNLHTSGDNIVEWMKGVDVPQTQPLRWYKVMVMKCGN